MEMVNVLFVEMSSKIGKKIMSESVLCFPECSKPRFNLVGVKLCKAICRFIKEFHRFLCCINDGIYCGSPGVKRHLLEKNSCLYLLSCLGTHDR